MAWKDFDGTVVAGRRFEEQARALLARSAGPNITEGLHKEALHNAAEVHGLPLFRQKQLREEWRRRDQWVRP